MRLFRSIVFITEVHLWYISSLLMHALVALGPDNFIRCTHLGQTNFLAASSVQQ